MRHDTSTSVIADPTPPGARTGGLRHIAALDGLRGAAVIGVIAFHAGLLPGGYLGVDLFFVLSGYLITSLLVLEHERTGRIDLRAFWTRRARRLLPALLVLIVVVAVVVVVVGARSLERSIFGSDAIATVLYVANWHAIGGGQGYWAQFASSSPLEHTWSLAIEEQFYLVWPLVAIAVLRPRGSDRSSAADEHDRAARRLLVTAVVGVVASSVLMIGGSLAGATTDRLYLGTDTRAAGILLGAALACAASRPDGAVSRANRPLVLAGGWIGAAILAVSWARLDGLSPWLYRGGFLICGAAATAIIASVALHEDGLLARLLAWRPLAAVGLVSYGLYLWHWPIFVYLDEARTGLTGASLLVVRLALTVTATLLSYRFVEMPVRRGAFRTRPALGAIAAMAVVILVAVVVARPVHAPTDAASAASAVAPMGPLAGADRTPPARVLILGDSVADSIADGLVPFQDAFGVEARSAAVAGCSIVRENPQVRYADGHEDDDSDCLDTVDRWSATVDSFQPDVVLMIIGWPGQTERYVEGAWRAPCDPVFDEWYGSEVLAAVEAVERAGSSVTLATAPYYRSPKVSVSSDDRTDCLNRVYRDVAERSSHPVIDLAGHVCPDRVCTSELDDTELRPDGLHFKGAASVWIADWLLREQWHLAAAGGA